MIGCRLLPLLAVCGAWLPLGALASPPTLIRALDEAPAARRQAAFWQLVEAPGAAAALEVHLACELPLPIAQRGAGHRRWWKRRALRFARLGYTRQLHARLGDVLAGHERLAPRERARQLVRIARAAGSLALPLVKVRAARDESPLVRRRAGRLIGELSLAGLAARLAQLARVGSFDEALALVDALAKRHPTEPQIDVAAARLLTQAGRLDEAFARFDVAVGKGFDNSLLLATDPDLAALREDPRIKRLVRSITGSAPD